jgi:hypothetical protein
MAEHRAVLLGQYVVSYLDYQVGSHSENVAVKGGVMDLAQRQSVGNDGLAQRIRP